jgi:hypothetical protein
VASKTLLLILATVVLTCGGIFGLYFLKLFAALAASEATRPGGTTRRGGRFMLPAALSFGLSFGSGWLLNYLLAHA